MSGVVFSVSSENVVSVGTRGTIVGDTRSTIVTGSYRGSSMDSAVTATVTVYQEANARLSLKLHSSPVSYTDIGADGSAAIPTIISYPCFWEYTSGSSLDVAKSSLSISFSKNWGGGSSYNNATINVSNGYVTADSLGTTVKSRENLLDSRVTFMIDGQSVEEVVYVYQEANARTSIEYGTPFVSLTVVDIPASGGAISSGTVTYFQSQRQYYTSGGYEDLSDITSGGTITYGSAVTASSLGTTVKGRASVGTLTATVTMNGKSGSDSATVYQEANAVESSSRSGGIITWESVTAGSISNATIPASGGTATARAETGSQSWVKSAVYRVDTYTSGSQSDPILEAEADSGNETISPSVSFIYGTAPSKGTTVSGITTVKSQDVTWAGNGGKSASGTMYVYQEANARTSIEYGVPAVTLTITQDISAAGGRVSNGNESYSQSRSQYYTSGDHEELSAVTYGGSVVYGSAVTAGSLGTTIKSRSKVGTLTVTVTMNGKSGSDSATVYQEANEATYGDVTVTATTPVSIPASGGSSTISPNASQTVSYTSGSTREGSVSFAYEVKTSKTGFSLSGATVTVTQNTSTSPRNGFVVMVTATGEGSKLATTDVTFNQAGASVVLPSWNAQDNYNFDADPQDSVQISISDPNNKGWEIRGNDNEFIVVDQEPHRLSTPYSGTGSVSFEFYLDPNTDSSVITNTVYLYSGSTLCESFSYVQESGASLDVTPTELSFVANGEGKTITITSNGDWTIS